MKHSSRLNFNELPQDLIDRINQMSNDYVWRSDPTKRGFRNKYEAIYELGFVLEIYQRDLNLCHTRAQMFQDLLLKENKKLRDQLNFG